jgi:hypothetical protein
MVVAWLRNNREQQSYQPEFIADYAADDSATSKNSFLIIGRREAMRNLSAPSRRLGTGISPVVAMTK